MLETTGTCKHIATMISPALEAMGYELVRVRLTSVPGARNAAATLQIMIDCIDGRMVNVEDCTDASRAVSAILDVEDPIPSAYVLEMSSPGIDRPLTRLKDFVRFAGFEAKLEAGEPVEGRKRWRGIVQGLEGEGETALVLVTLDDGALARVPFAALAKAKLVLTDALIAWTQAQAVAQGGAADGAEMDIEEDNLADEPDDFVEGPADDAR